MNYLLNKLRGNIDHFIEEWELRGSVWKRSLHLQIFRPLHSFVNFCVESCRHLPYITGHIVAFYLLGRYVVLPIWRVF